MIPRSRGAMEAGETVTVKVAHGLRLHEVAVPPNSTFGELKAILAPLTGVFTHEQRLLFKGLQKEDSIHLDAAGVKQASKLILIEDLASKQRKLEESKRNERISKACQEVALVRSTVDKLAAQVTCLETEIESGNTVSKSQFGTLSELLTQQLLRLDCIEVDGDAGVQRKSEIQRVLGYCDTIDQLEAKNNTLVHGDNTKTNLEMSGSGDKD